MQDAMTIWASICHSRWFKQTSIVRPSFFFSFDPNTAQILFLNKNDLYERKIARSHIKNLFPDYEGGPDDAKAGRDYFKRCFGRLAQKAGQRAEREIYI